MRGCLHGGGGSRLWCRPKTASLTKTRSVIKFEIGEIHEAGNPAGTGGGLISVTASSMMGFETCCVRMGMAKAGTDCRFSKDGGNQIRSQRECQCKQWQTTTKNPSGKHPKPVYVLNHVF